MDAEAKHFYEMRLKRLIGLAKLDAPPVIIAREALLVAAAAVSKDKTVKGLIPFILTDFDMSDPQRQ